MKKIMILIASFSMLMACKKDRPELQPPASKMVGIQDDWQLSKVIQFDEITQRELDTRLEKIPFPYKANLQYLKDFNKDYHTK